MSPRRRVYLIAAGVIALTFALFFWAPGFLKTVETKLYDLHFTIRGVRSPGDQVVVAAIDEKSLAAIGRWPWPRSVLARLVRILSEGGAKVIALDILLSEPEVSGEIRAAEYLSEHWSDLGLPVTSPQGRALRGALDGLVRRADHDGQLEEAVRQSGRVVLPLVFEIKPQISEVPPVPSGSPLKSRRAGRRWSSSIAATTIRRWRCRRCAWPRGWRPTGSRWTSAVTSRSGPPPFPWIRETGCWWTTRVPVGRSRNCPWSTC
ncbi:MAG: hypothetical protein DMD86_18950 [Candidatus Rokuibacteriota bacterium]|nr:MAG: hypothetical protein DMD86_18950 [Candidatus Rokubacteria bacterium]